MELDPEKHHYRAIAIVVVGAVVAAVLFYLVTNKDSEYAVGSVAWYAALLVTFICFLAFAYFSLRSTLTFRLKIALAFVGLASFGYLVWIIVEHRPFNAAHITNKLVRIFDLDGTTTPAQIDPLIEPKADADWTKHVPAILNQGRCGSCWAFSSSLLLSTLDNIRKEREDAAAKWMVSPQWMLDVDPPTTQPHGKCEGQTLRRGFDLARSKDALTLGCLPYYASNYTACDSGVKRLPPNAPVHSTNCMLLGENGSPIPECMKSSADLPGAVKVQDIVIISKDTPSANSMEKRMQHEISTNGPIICGIDYYAGVPWAMEGVAPGTGNAVVHAPVLNAPAATGGHAVTIVGYGTSSAGTKYWLFANSWGSAWGNKGYSKIIRGVNAWGIEDMCVSATLVALPNEEK